jgi:hypothetical protein
MRVRVNSTYIFKANGWDTFDAKHNGYLSDGDLVRVVDLHGCPKANTMGQCYVRKVGDTSNAFAMVSTGSLSVPADRKRANDNRRAMRTAMKDLGLTRVVVNGKEFFE